MSHITLQLGQLAGPSGACGGLGAGAMGAMGVGDGGHGILDVAQASLNSIRVNFTFPVKQLVPTSPDDALTPGNYTVVPILPPDAITRLVISVESINNSAVLLLLDGVLPEDSIYSVVMADTVVDVNGALLACLVDAFRTLSPAEVQPSASTDLANPSFLKDADLVDPPPLGTLQITDRGDIGLDTGVPYLRKRVLRRVTTAFGGFFHLPNYGFVPPLKSRVSRGVLQTMQSRARAQIIREPDVQQATVIISRGADPSLVIIDIRILTVRGTVEPISLPLRLDDRNARIGTP